MTTISYQVGVTIANMTAILSLPSFSDISVAGSMARSLPPNQGELTALLYQCMCLGDVSGVQAALRAGANVNFRKHPSIVIAAQRGSVRIVESLIEYGANVNMGMAEDMTTSEGGLMWNKGTTAVYIAVHNFHLDIVRVLLRAGADIDVTSAEGVTPLMCACIGQEGREAEGALMLREVLDAGADTTIATPEGMTAAHFAIVPGSTALLDILLSMAPAVANQVVGGTTPLYVAAEKDAGKALLSLLAAGAKQPVSLRTRDTCPLVEAAIHGHSSVVQAFIDKGMEAIGGSSALPQAMSSAASHGQANILQMLLDAEGEDRREHWARSHSGNTPLLYFALGYGGMSSLSVLLAAGADEAIPTTAEFFSKDMVGLYALTDDGKETSRSLRMATAAATRRMLKRAPAFRARSWLWPANSGAPAAAAVSADCCHDGGSGAILSPEEREWRVASGVRVFQPRNKNVVVGLICR